MPDPDAAGLARLAWPVRIMVEHTGIFLTATYCLLMAVGVTSLTERPAWTPEQVDERNAKAIADLRRDTE